MAITGQESAPAGRRCLPGVRRVGILGGTFNPIHVAHLRIAEEVREACDLEEILFLPAADPPHKPVAGAVLFRHRLAMVAAAIADHPAFRCSDIEAQRHGKSFSVDTLDLLRARQPDCDFYFIIGLDSWRDLTSWKEYARLFQLANLVVTARPGIEIGDPLALLPVAVRQEFCYSAEASAIRHRSGHLLIFLTETRLDISSTVIRAKLARGESIRYLVPDPVARYLTTHGLYQGPA
ncbi:MAG: nicotinate-nucleotide adenylyltransferase [Desulfuromonadales bacterium]|nr:nicotinate-nucleotide adenylyltransferase [Desulfuromonadales bacterium]